MYRNTTVLNHFALVYEFLSFIGTMVPSCQTYQIEHRGAFGIL